MDITRLKTFATFTGVQPITVNDSNVLLAEYIVSTLYARIWRSAIVVKNKRESDKGGAKATIQQALTAGLIDNSEALNLLLATNTARMAELREALPHNAKTDEPTDEDIKIAVAQLIANKGQAS
jgi:hypothetical protein